MIDRLPLKDLLDFTRDGEWGKGEASPGHIQMAVIRGTDFANVRSGNFSGVPIRFIPISAAERKTLRPGDILIETAGGTKDQPTGRTVFLSERTLSATDLPITCASFSRFLRVKPDVVDPRYLFWYLQSIYATGEMLPYHIQHTGVARFQYTDFATQWRVPIPPMDQQREIADALSILDDKIELNRRMNETLEAMAQAIFRDWFVDFGPTRRKIAGATGPVAIMGDLTPDPARAAPLAALFPDALGDEGLPDSWVLGALGDIAQSASDSVDPASIDPETPYIGLEHMPRRSIALTDWEAAAKVSSNKSRFRRGQVLFGKLRPYFHKVGVAPVDGVCSTDIVVLEARKPEWQAFVVACASSEAFVAYTDQTSTGTKMPRTSWGTMRKYPLITTPRSVIEAYGTLVDPMIEKITAAIHESRTLAETRDLLLPKLMSGEIRLAEARATEEDAAAG